MDIYDSIHSNFSKVLGSNNGNQTSEKTSWSNVTVDFVGYAEKLVARQQSTFLPTKTQVLNIMKQIIYKMRYRIKYIDPLRVKYRTNDKYKVGFWIHKVRNLKLRMTNVFSTAMNNKHWNFHSHLLLYNNLVNVNVDVASIVERIAVIHERIMIAEKIRPGRGPGRGSNIGRPFAAMGRPGGGRPVGGGAPIPVDRPKHGPDGKPGPYRPGGPYGK